MPFLLPFIHFGFLKKKAEKLLCPSMGLCCVCQQFAPAAVLDSPGTAVSPRHRVLLLDPGPRRSRPRTPPREVLAGLADTSVHMPSP